MTKYQLEEHIKKYVNPPYNEELVKLIEPSIRLRTIPTPDEQISIGSSKIGGLPDLPKNVEWFHSDYYDKGLFWFLAQINLKDVKLFDEKNLLPKSGILYFFAYWDTGKVYYFDGDQSELTRAFLPKEFKEEKRSFWQRLFKKKQEQKVFQSCLLKIDLEYDIFTREDNYYIERLKKKFNVKDKNIEILQDEFYVEYERVTKETELTSRHKILGYPNGIQYGYFFGDKEDPADYTIEQYDELLGNILLFQLDSDDNANMCWADWGRHYFFIHKEDLKKADFTKVQHSFDCY